MKRATALAMLMSCGVVVAACNAVFGLDPGTLDESECVVNVDCDDANPCTFDQCVSGNCISVGGPNVAIPNDEQTPNDCLRKECKAEGALEDVIDESDAPDDGNDCTVDECRSDTPHFTLVDVGSRCDNGNRFCDAEGTCVACLSDSDCITGAPSFCETRTCEMGVCTSSFAPADTPHPEQAGGDCQERVCDGNGGITTRNDAMDLPVDGKPCTEDRCDMDAGVLVPSNPNLANGTMCGPSPLECTDGFCTGCTMDAECDALETDCTTYTCNLGTNTCDFTHRASGTATSSQTDADCLENVCNGQGAVSTVNDATDVFDDANACTNDICSEGSPVNLNLPVDEPCSDGGGTFCDGSGACVECNSPSQCNTAGSNECAIDACEMNDCTITPVADGVPIASQMSGDCTTVVCDGAGSTRNQSTPADEPPEDNNDCTDLICSGGSPGVVHLDGSACMSSGSGGFGSGFCSSGVCVQCYNDTHCPSSGECCDLGTNLCISSGCAAMS